MECTFHLARDLWFSSWCTPSSARHSLLAWSQSTFKLGFLWPLWIFVWGPGPEPMRAAPSDQNVMKSSKNAIHRWRAGASQSVPISSQWWHRAAIVPVTQLSSCHLSTDCPHAHTSQLVFTRLQVSIKWHERNKKSSFLHWLQLTLLCKGLNVEDIPTQENCVPLTAHTF